MFIGYNKARGSGLSEKDILQRAFVLNALRIGDWRSRVQSKITSVSNVDHSSLCQPAEGSPRYNHLRRGSPSLSRPERHKGRFVSLGPGNFPARLNVTVHAQPRCVFDVL